VRGSVVCRLGKNAAEQQRKSPERGSNGFRHRADYSSRVL
jgi:hypothetical protein